MVDAVLSFAWLPRRGIEIGASGLGPKAALDGSEADQEIRGRAHAVHRRCSSTGPCFGVGAAALAGGSSILTRRAAARASPLNS